MGQPLSFDDLIPKAPAAQGSPLSFDDLIPSGNKPTGQPPANGEGVSPQNSNIGNNQQFDLAQQLHNWGNSPTNVDYSDIPSSGQGLSTLQKIGDAGTVLGRGMAALGSDMVKPTARGMGDMLDLMKGNYQAQTDTSGSNPLNLTPDAVGALTMISPTMEAGIARRAINTNIPIGNRAVNYISDNFPKDSSGIDNFLDKIIPARTLEDANLTANVPSSSALMRGFGARDNDALQEASDANFAQSSGLYKQMRQAGAVLNQDSANDLKNTINNSLNANPDNVFIPQLNPKTVGIVQHLSDAIDQGGVGLDQIDQYRRLLNRVGGSEDGYSAGVVKKALDQHVNDIDQSDLANGSSQAVDLLNQARSSYANASRFDDVADVLKSANGDPNKIKAGLTKFINNDRNTLGWSQGQIDALRNAADTGVGENVLKAIGKFGIDFSKSGTGNTVLPALAALAKSGGAAFLPGGIPLVTGATILRQGQKYLARGKAEQLLDTLKYEAPEAQFRSPPDAPLMLNSPSINPPLGGNSVYQAPVGPSIDYNFGQKQLPDYFTAPDPRALTYQPRPDFMGTADGQVAQVPTNINDIIDLVRRMKQ